jgi:hypothetical protein
MGPCLKNDGGNVMWRVSCFAQSVISGEVVGCAKQCHMELVNAVGWCC